MTDSYYLLETSSDDPVRISEEERNRLLAGVPARGDFLLRKGKKIVDIEISEKPPKLVLNYSAKLLLGVIQKSFLESMMRYSDAEKYIDFAKLIYNDGGKEEETDFLLYKCKHVIFVRGKKTINFKKGNKTTPTFYDSSGPRYITHIPSLEIPIYGSQTCGLIVREDLLASVLGKKHKKLYVSKLKIQDPVDGVEFKDSISLY